MNKCILLTSLIALGLLLAPAGAAQVTLGGDADLTDGASLDGIANSGGDGSTGSPYLYQFTTDGLDLDVYKVYTTVGVGGYGDSILLNMGGYNIDGTGTTAISTDVTADTGAVTIINVGEIDMGGIRTGHVGGSATDSTSGDITIGQANDNPGNGEYGRAGNIRVDFLELDWEYAYANDYNTGSVNIYSSGNVFVRNSAGDVLGNIDTHRSRTDWNNKQRSGSIMVNHDGGLVADQILTYNTGDNYSDTGGVTLEGDGLGDGASGYLNVNTINTEARLHFRYDTLDTHISGYLGVTINDIITRAGYAGDITIEDIEGDVLITGTIDAGSDDITLAGVVSITADGKIELTSPASLDLDKLLTAFFDAGGNTFITGPLYGFNTGTPDDGELDAPGGQFIYYDPAVTENQYLVDAGGTFTLASGGVLTPIVPEPATMGLLALGGLIGLSGLRRRRGR
jgi:hypothetical protein